MEDSIMKLAEVNGDILYLILDENIGMEIFSGMLTEAWIEKRMKEGKTYTEDDFIKFIENFSTSLRMCFHESENDRFTE